MKATGNPNLNSQTYWNYQYNDEVRREGYIKNEMLVDGNQSQRFNFALKEVPDNSKVLDIGCGVGYFTELVYHNKTNCEVWGVDISNTVIEFNKTQNPNITYKAGHVGALEGIPANYFDFVFSGEVLEHLDNPVELFLDAYRALKPGGKFLITTPDQDHIKSDEHVWYFTHDDIEDYFLGAEFDDVRFIYLPKLEHLFVIMAIGTKK